MSSYNSGQYLYLESQDASQFAITDTLSIEDGMLTLRMSGDGTLAGRETNISILNGRRQHLISATGTDRPGTGSTEICDDESLNPFAN